MFHQSHNLYIRVIERGHPESHEVWWPEIGDDTIGRHLLNQGFTARKPKRHMASTGISGTWRL
jgi:hypothetical protein